MSRTMIQLKCWEANNKINKRFFFSFCQTNTYSTQSTIGISSAMHEDDNSPIAIELMNLQLSRMLYLALPMKPTSRWESVFDLWPGLVLLLCQSHMSSNVVNEYGIRRLSSINFIQYAHTQYVQHTQSICCH